MSNSGNPVNALGHLLRAGMRAATGGGTNTIMGVTERAILGDRDRTVNEIRRMLVDSQSVFLYGGNVVLEKRSASEGKRLVPLMMGDRLHHAACAHLSNLFHCGVGTKEKLTTCQVPAKVVSEVLNNDMTRDQLPRISYYSRRPVFNADFVLRGPGYWPEDGLLVHDEAIEPILWTPSQAERAIDRLPPALQRVFRDFCFDSDADLVNALAIVLTGVLANLFVDSGKPTMVFDGNQKGIGKTLLANTIGLVLDGVEAPKINHTDDEDELGKRLGSKLKLGHRFSVLLFDNQKGKIGGGLLESMALAPSVSVRLLGHNEDISRINDFLWVFTMNNAQATTDMTSRSVLIRLRYEGEPNCRFRGTNTEEQTLKEFVTQHRRQILGELFGMIVRWRDAGKPLGTQQHRCKRWAEFMGGILGTAGLPEFLRNHEDAAIEIDEDLQDVIALAEVTVGNRQEGFFAEHPVNESEMNKTPTDWSPVFNATRILSGLAHSTSERAKAIAIGKFFGARLNRPVPIQVGERTGTATLKARPAGRRQRYYWFEVVWGDSPEAGDSTTSDTSAASPNRRGGHGQVEERAVAFAATENVATSPDAPPTPSASGSYPSPTGNDLAWDDDCG